MFDLPCLRFGDAELGAFYSGGRLNPGPYVLREKTGFFYGIDYEFGGFVYVVGGDLFGIDELLEVGRGLGLCVSSV